MGNKGSGSRPNVSHVSIVRPNVSVSPNFAYVYSEKTPDEWTYGPAPPQPLFPWQFMDEQLRERRKLLREAREEKLKRKTGSDAPQPEKERPSQASIPPEDGTCCFDMLPREILLYILQDVGEATLSTACLFINRQFSEAAQDEQLWRHLYLVDVGRAPPPLSPPDKYSNPKWHRQAVTEKEEYYYKVWKWYESYGGSFRDVREERFPDATKQWLEVSPFATSRMALFNDIHSFDRRKLRRVQTNDRSAPRLPVTLIDPAHQAPHAPASSGRGRW